MPETRFDEYFEEPPERERLRAPLPASGFASAAASALGLGKRGKLGSFSGSGGSGLAWGEGLLLVPASESAALAEVEALVRAGESERARSYALGLTQGSLDVRLPVCEGSFVRVLAVEERSALVDYDVEIAEEAWIPVPRVERVLAGLVVEGPLQGGALLARGWRAASGPDVRVEKTQANLGALALLDGERSVLSARIPAESTRELASPGAAHPAVSVALSPAR